MHRRQPTYRMGEWLAQCDRCAETHWSSELRLEWTNLRVCRTCWDPRHPQDHVKGVKDDQAPPWSRPRQDGGAVGGLTWSTTAYRHSEGRIKYSSGGKTVRAEDL